MNGSFGLYAPAEHQNRDRGWLTTPAHILVQGLSSECSASVTRCGIKHELVDRLVEALG